jgi:hypothetical protein
VESGKLESWKVESGKWKVGRGDFSLPLGYWVNLAGD